MNQAHDRTTLLEWISDERGVEDPITQMIEGMSDLTILEFFNWLPDDVSSHLADTAAQRWLVKELASHQAENARYRAKEPPPRLKTLGRSEPCLLDSSLALAALVNVAILRRTLNIDSLVDRDGRVPTEQLLQLWADTSTGAKLPRTLLAPLYSSRLTCNLSIDSPIVDLLVKNQNLYQVFTRHSEVKLLHVPQPSYVLDERVLTENEYAVLVRGTTFSVITRHNGCVLELDLLSQCWANLHLQKKKVQLELGALSRIGGRALSPVAARRSKAKGAAEAYTIFKNWLRSPTPLLPADIQKTCPADHPLREFLDSSDYYRLPKEGLYHPVWHPVAIPYTRSYKNLLKNMIRYTWPSVMDLVESNATEATWTDQVYANLNRIVYEGSELIVMEGDSSHAAGSDRPDRQFGFRKQVVRFPTSSQSGTRRLHWCFLDIEDKPVVSGHPDQEKLEEILERRINRARETFGTEQSGTVPFPVAIGMLREGPLWSLILTRFADEDEEMYRHRFIFHREKLNDPKGFFLMATVMARIRAYGEEYFQKVGTLAKTEAKNIDNRGRSDKKDNEREDEDGGEDEKEAEEKKVYEGNAQDSSQKRPSRDSSSTQQDSLPRESLEQEYSACERLVGGSSWRGVFKCRRASDNEEVVVKSRSRLDLYWFNREVALYQMLHSTANMPPVPMCIPRMYRHFHDLEKKRYVMELEHVPCVSRHFMPADSTELSQFLNGLAKALEFVHSCGVIHRDIKPSNILVSRVSGGDLVVKIADWEHAKFEHEQHPQGFSEVVGTYGYIAPECMHLESPAADYHSRASDMWSVGIIVLELMLSVRLAGKPEEAEELARLVVQQHYDAAATAGDGRTPGPKRRKTTQADDQLTVLLVDYVAEKGLSVETACRDEPTRFLSPPLLELCAALLDPDAANRPSAAQVLAFPFFADA